MGNYHFKSDLCRSVRNEKVVCDILTERNKKKGIRFTRISNHPDYDCVAIKGHKIRKIECKEDMMCKKTGNIAIEVYNNRNQSKSGISILDENTILFYTIHCENDIVRMCHMKAKVVQEFIKNKGHLYSIKQSGDKFKNSKAAQCYIVPWQVVWDLAKENHRIDNIGSKRYEDKIRRV